MNIQEFYNYIKHPDLLNETSLNELNEVIQRYPFFQAARMLYLKNLALLNDDRYQAMLTQTSIYAPDRKALYFLINNQEEKIEVQDNVEVLNDEQIEVPIVEQEKETAEKNKLEIDLSINIKTEEDAKPEEKEQPNVEYSENKHESISIADQILKKVNEIKQNTSPIENKQIDKSELFEIKTEKKEPESSTLTFDEWLYYISSQKEEKKQDDTVVPEKSLIDQFLENAPSLSRIKVEPGTVNEDLTEQLTPPEELEIVSESLAQLYYKQGYFEKALKMYEKLILKYPEKSIYFASSIQEIKNKLDKS
ncbi:MAG TPA: tetratricopeptide repeat protein [Bacteroidales bacterium]|nr:tetratricopeptide repeat protein [Bacteroidales bacterium]HOU98194.1 tetratricopeptide repeat protein [Bacteroidales bacterium]